MGKSSSIETDDEINRNLHEDNRGKKKKQHSVESREEGGETETLFDGWRRAVSQSVSHADLFRLTPSLLFPSPPSHFPPLSLKQGLAGGRAAGRARNATHTRTRRRMLPTPSTPPTQRRFSNVRSAEGGGEVDGTTDTRSVNGRPRRRFATFLAAVARASATERASYAFRRSVAVGPVARVRPPSAVRPLLALLHLHRRPDG